ncbi:non-ribosomal peptide synthetase, partial [Rhodococcoides kyotonense]
AEPDGHRDPEYLVSVIESEGVTATSFVPSMLAAFVSQVDSARLQSLRHVLVAGEAFSGAVAASARSALPGASVHNLYGPTEFTVHATAYSLVGGESGGSVPIGRPVWNSAVYVLDSRLSLAPAGVVGELYLSGVQLARGYFGRAELTADRFVASPFGDGERLYRTGDLVRWDAAGELLYVGRSDFQVKLRGQRIELGEIETALARLESVAHAAAAVRSDRLVAYVVPSAAGLDTDGLNAALTEVLPSYMVPSTFVVLDAFPLGSSGKLDRKALPEPVFEVREFRAPQTPVQEIVARVFADLLDVDRVGLDDDFFALGGNSLIATQALSRIGAELGERIVVRALFDASSVEALAARVESRTGDGRVPLVARSRPDQVPLSLAQQRMWFLSRLDPDSAVDNIPVAVRLRGHLDIEALRAAVSDVIARHEILRTVYPEVDGVGYQDVRAVSDVEIDLVPHPVLEDEILASAYGLFARGFDVTVEPPVRTRLSTVAPDDHVLLVVVHHIAADGFSIGPLTRDIMIAYSARANDDVPAWAPLPVQYADYTLWQREVLGSADDADSVLSRQQSYWVGHLAGLPDQLDIPLSRPRPLSASGLGAMHTFSIGSELRSAVENAAAEHKATPFMVMHAALAILLSRLSGTTDVAVGTPVAGRGDSALDDMVGMFVNTLVLRSDVSPSATFGDVLSGVRRTDIDAFEHADVPFERLVEVLDPPRSQGRHPLVQVLLAFQNVGGGTFELPGLSISGVEFDATVAKMDLQLTVSDGPDAGYRVDVTYATDLFDASAVEVLGKRLVRVLDAIVSDSDVVVGDIELAEDSERAVLLRASVGDVVDIGSDATVLDAFSRRVVERPDAVAVRFGGASWTYAEFDARVSEIARALRAEGVGAGSTVAVSMRRSAEMVAALYGVVRAGAAYVPIDPDHPAERTDYILDLVRPNLVLTAEVLDGLTRVRDVSVGVDGAATSGGAAYVLFTSGSTGRPKGVTVSHAAVVNQVSWLVAEYGLGAGDVVLQKTPFTFDVSVWELFGALASGATLVVAEPNGHRDPEYLASVIESEGVTATSFVPSMLSAFVSQVRPDAVASLRNVLVAGEAFGTSVAEAASAVMPSARLHNLYGPTEFTVHATAYSLVGGESGAGVPIGRPVWNSAVYVLDSRLSLAPVGVVGELYLSGVQLAEGYFGRADLTADRFVASPFGVCERLYRTGDLVRWSIEGELVYVGRSDFQVKLRGQRIELGEIEAAVGALDSVSRAVVDVRSDRLVAYVVPAGDALETVDAREALGRVLPSYMVPSSFVVLDALPVGASGKLDRKALPDPVFEVREFRAPQTPVQEIVASVFADVLGVDQVGLDDDFFELGGNSLLATQVAARIGAAVDARVPVRVLFDASSVEAVASRVVVGTDARTPLVARERPTHVPLSLAQQRMWFLNRLDPDSAVDNIPIAVRVQGELNVAALESAVRDVVARHEVLRTVYPEVDGVGHQDVRTVADVDIDLAPRDVAERDVSAAVVEFFAAGFDVSTTIPFRTRLLRSTTSDHVLLVVVHHIAADGFSVAPLTRDIMIAYAARADDDVPAWAPLPVQYADYTLWQRDVLGSSSDVGSLMSVQEQYWTSQLDAIPDEISLPTDRPRPLASSGIGAVHTVSLPSVLRASIESCASQHRATPFMVVHAALAVVLSRLSGSGDVAIGTPVAGRGEAVLDDLVGMFVNTLVLRAALSWDAAFGDVLESVRTTDIDAFEHADLPFERLVEVLDPPRSQGRHPLVQVLLSFQNIRTDTFELPGMSVSAVDFDAVVSKMDLQVTVSDDADGGYRVDLTYATDLFDASSAARIGDQLVRVLNAVVEDSSVVVGDIELTDSAERDRLTAWAEGPMHDIDCDVTVLDAFARRVVERPDAVAVRFGGASWTYAEFDARVSEIARALRAEGVGAGSVVAVSMRRSAEMVAALYGVVRAGAAYVPIDPDHPAERTEYILDSVRPVLVLTAGVLGDLGSSDVAFDSEALPRPAPNAAAYVLFTSGSTGRPKGVTVSHASAVNQVSWLVAEYGLGAGDVVLQKTPFTFDVSVWELFGALASGATLVVAEPDGHRDPEYLASVIESEGVTATSFVPSMLSVFVSQVNSARLQSLRHVLVAGEALSAHVATDARTALPDTEIHNLYGPTEFTVHATAYSLVGGESGVPIGRPVWNSSVYVLDSRLSLAPVGVVGELYLSGVQLAEGYFGRAELTADRFVASPFGDGERFYRTGDLVRWNAAGELLYVGRSDFQVKLRGQRIELGEVESAVAAVDSVSRAVVEVRRDQLVAYVVGTEISIDGVKASLGQVLPSYMVPSSFVVLDALPVGASGKLDRKALPDPEFSVARYRAPSTDVECAVAEIFGDVLGGEAIGLDDDFFSLGGNSLIATQVIARLAERLGRRVPLRLMFDASTVETFAAKVALLAESDDRPPLTAQPRPERIPLSLAQQRLWILNRLHPNAGVRNIPVAVRLTGPLDVPALQSAVRDLLGRHESLRTMYPEFDGDGYQLIRDVEDVVLDLDPVAIGEADVSATVEDIVTRGFDVTGDVPLRTALLRVAADDHVLVFVAHHISADGFSMRPLTADVMIAYAARSAGVAPEQQPLAVQYADYTLWQRGVLGSDTDPNSRMAHQLGYWREQLDGLPEGIDLPLDHPRPDGASYRGATVRFPVSADLRAACEALAREHNASLFMVVHTALAVLLGRLSVSTDVAVSSPTAGRGATELDGLIGMFVNSLVLRTRTTPFTSFADMLAHTRDVDLEAFANSDVPFERVMEEIDPDRRWLDGPRIPVALSFQNLGWGSLELSGLRVEPVGFDAGFAKYDLHFVVEDAVDDDGRACLFGSITHSSDLFDESTVTEIGEQLVRVLVAGTSDPSVPIGDIDVIGEAELSRTIAAWNDATTAIPSASIVPDLLDRQAVATPDAVAVTFADTRLTFDAFAARVARTARWLISRGVGPDERVAVTMHRSIDLVVAVHAVVAAGGAYVPIDPDQPSLRTDHVLAVARPIMVLTSIDDATIAEFSDAPVTDEDRIGPLRPENTCYVMFTSGSTGQPKGVAVPHSAVANQVSWLVAEYGLNELDVVLHKTPFTFDVSVWELFGAPASGARMVVAEPDGHRDPRYLASLVESEGVTATSFVPSMLAVFTSQAGTSRLQSLRHVLVAGEELGRSVARAASDALPGAQLHNLYGPTEFAVHATAYPYDPAEPAPTGRGDGVPIGEPVWNSGAYVLNSRLQPSPVGVVGELYLAGVQLARAYEGRPDLTAERFVAHPFRTAGERVYRTGDLVRRTRTGRLVYVTRSDGQVKLRGQRVELGEIEAALLHHDSVASAAVDVRGDRLVGYVTRRNGSDLAPDEIRHAVRSVLPKYMVPAVIVVMDSLPTTASGKLDRDALPDPVVEIAAYRAPTSPVEDAVATVFADVMRIPRAGLDDDFFELGGNSLSATKVISRLGDALDATIPLSLLFDASSVEELAAAVSAYVSSGSRVPLVGRRRPEAIPLSVQQQRTWMLSQWIPKSPYFNIPVTVRLTGPIDVDALAAAAHDVQVRHESLRTIFPKVDDSAVQKILPADAVRLDMAPIEVSETDLSGRIAELLAVGFDTATEPPLRITLFRLSEEEHVVVVVFHHIAADGSSFAPFARDLTHAYGARAVGEEPGWEPLAVQYADYALWQRETLGELTDPESVASRQMQFWRETLAGQPDLLNVELDHPRPEVRTMAGSSVTLGVDRDIHAAIDRCARDTGTTRFMVVHAAMAAVLARWSGNADVTVGTPTAGRGNELLDDLVGMFVSTVVLRTVVDTSISFADVLAEVRRQDIAAFENVDVPFDWLLNELLPPRPVAQVPFFQVMMAFQNYEQHVAELGAVKMESMATSTTTAKLDLHFSFVEAVDPDGACAGMSIEIAYATELFDEPTVVALGEAFRRVLSVAVSDPTAIVGDIDMKQAVSGHITNTDR